MPGGYWPPGAGRVCPVNLWAVAATKAGALPRNDRKQGEFIMTIVALERFDREDASLRELDEQELDHVSGAGGAGGGVVNKGDVPVVQA